MQVSNQLKFLCAGQKEKILKTRRRGVGICAEIFCYSKQKDF